MKIPPLATLLYCALVFAVLVSGAGCSTVSSRTEERPQAFNNLPQTERELVKQSKIKAGMSKDAVYIAFGKPDKTTPGTPDGKPGETWIYFGVRQQVISNYHVIPRPAGRGFTTEMVYNPIYISHPYVRRQVFFQNEKVVAWNEPVSR